MKIDDNEKFVIKVVVLLIVTTFTYLYTFFGLLKWACETFLKF